MGFYKKLNRIVERAAELQTLLSASDVSDPKEFVKLSREYADIAPIAEGITKLQRATAQVAEAKELLADPGADKEFKDMAAQEIHDLEHFIKDQEMRIQVSLLPKDEADEKSAIMEIRAGTGGDEAALFAGDLLRMYQRYADLKGWKVELMDISETERGGVREVSLSINGRGVFARLKFESGVHRVQRVPETEASGRIHTSAATVAVLPEAEEIDIVLEDKDLRIDVFRSSGPGGQSVNTTDSAVRIIHLPTGIVVQQQDEKSQHKNKAKALRILRSRIYDAQRSKQDAERAASRKTQVGSGDRSERIRTYNYPQGRVSDHRINLTLYKIDQVTDGSALDEFIEALIANDQATRLSDLGDDD